MIQGNQTKTPKCKRYIYILSAIERHVCHPYVVAVVASKRASFTSFGSITIYPSE